MTSRSDLAISAPPDASLPFLTRLSRAVARIEATVSGLLVAGLFLVLMGNVVSRALQRPLIWSDELAVHMMIWAALTGASVGLARREHIAVTLLPDALAPLARHRLAIAVDVAMLVFFVILSVLVWRWFDLPGLLRAGSFAAHATTTWNFMWQEPTVTLGLRKAWFWMILPIFCVTGGLHVLASLSARLSARPEAAA